MLLFLLPLILNPFGLAVSWLPTLYLALWPLIIQTLGRDALVTHSLVLIMFILTCDIVRQTMFRYVSIDSYRHISKFLRWQTLTNIISPMKIGFDLISFPVGIAFLAMLLTQEGSILLSLIKPLYDGALSIVEPLFLLLEIYLAMDLIKKFNSWISQQSNIRNEDSHDLSSWEPPLAVSSILARTVVILISLFSYVGVYLIIQESKSLIGNTDDVPCNFSHAIAALVTLQLIALTVTIYKDEGIISESAMIALAATVPILIASWSYSNLLESHSKSR